MRTFAIIVTNPSRVATVRHSLLPYLIGQNVIVACPDAARKTLSGFANEFICIDPTTPMSDIRNKVISTISKTRHGHLHVIEDTVDLPAPYADFDKFMTKVEHMMDVFGVTVWFNTSTDKLNYVYEKYNPRCSINMDSLEYKDVIDFDIGWCSHCNTSYSIYNLDKTTESELTMQSGFNVAMYYIIEYIWRQHNDPATNSFKFMNFYPTVIGETSYIRYCSGYQLITPTREDMQREGVEFDKLNVHPHPDTNIDCLLDFCSSQMDKYKGNKNGNN